MFDSEFYPTPYSVISYMILPNEVKGKKFLEPQAGKGDIVDYLYEQGAEDVLACETNQNLRKILADKCKLIGIDFFDLRSDQISHVDYIIMNPPYSNADEHILHAYNIAPNGCKIRCLCNYETINKLYTSRRKELMSIIDTYGSYENIGNRFRDAERKTGIDIAFIKIDKPASFEKNEFEGFFMDEEPEEAGSNGIMKFNAVRDIVQRYVNSVKCFDEHKVISDKMNSLTGSFKTGSFGFTIGYDKIIFTKKDFCKELQRAAWQSIFSKLNMEKYSTKGVKEDINKFVENQYNVPFTMKNVFHMLHIVIGTQQSRMDKAILEVFDKVTKHYDENRYDVEGWKTNSHYLLNKKFIMPSAVSVGWSGEVSRGSWSTSSFELIEDLLKAMCYVSGDNYSKFISLDDFISYKFKLVNSEGDFINDKGYDFDVKITSRSFNEIERKKADYPGSKIRTDDIEFGKWFDWAYFRVKAYKKGTLHIEFKDTELWSKFNQIVAKLKGYPLYEYKKNAK